HLRDGRRQAAQARPAQVDLLGRRRRQPRTLGPCPAHLRGSAGRSAFHRCQGGTSTMTDARIESDPKTQTLLDAGAAVADGRPVSVGGRDVAVIQVVPEGYDVQTVNLEALRAPYRDRPVRKSGTVHVDTVEALVEYHSK